MSPVVAIGMSLPCATITLQRPEKRNALSRQLLTELQEAFGDLHQEKRVRAVILTGAGSAFCAGMDLGEMRATAVSDNPQAQWQQDAIQYQELIETMLRFPKPIIAAVNGPAIAGGLGLVLASDLVVAAEAATFGLPEPRRGIIAGLVAPLLAFRVGGGHAARLLLLADSVPAAAAKQMGLFHEVVAADELASVAHQWGVAIAQSAPEAIALSKRMLNETIGESLFTALAAGAAASAAARTTEAATEGLTAFLEKREPRWP